MKMKLLGICALLVISLAACGRAEGPETVIAETVETSSVSEVEQSGVESRVVEEEKESESVADPNLEPMDAVLLYIYQPEAEIYSAKEVAIPVDGITVASVIKLIAKEVHIAYAQPRIEQIKGQMILDFDGTYVDDILHEGETETIFLNSMCATLMENGFGAEWFDLRKDGGAYVSANLTLSSDEPYPWPPLKIGTGTEEEYTALRDTIPYDGLSNRMEQFINYNIVKTDDTGRKLITFLERVGDPKKDVASPAELGNQYILERAMGSVYWYTTSNYGQSEEYIPTLRPITIAVEDDLIAFGEHVAKTVADVFGDVPLVHEDVDSLWKWHAVEGVYTPPHMGGSTFAHPVIFSYEDLGDSYRIEMTFVRDGMGAYLDDDGETIPQDKLADTVTNKLRRREIILDKTADGGLRFRSHRYL